MSLKTYGYSAQVKRIKLIRGSELLAFIALVLVVCLLVFPRDLSDSLRDSKLDAVSQQYIETWLLAKPDDVQLRILLVQELIQFGQLAEAHYHLEIIERSDKKDVAEKGYWLHAQLEFERLMAVQPESRRNNVLWSISQQSLRKVNYKTLPADQIAQFVRMALLLGFAKEAYAAAEHRLTKADTKIVGIIEIADGFVAYQSYSAAANLYGQALTRSTDPKQQAKYFLAALSSYQAGSLFDQGGALIERFGGLFLENDQVLYRIVLFARAANKPSLASFYASYLMDLEVNP